MSNKKGFFIATTIFLIAFLIMGLGGFYFKAFEKQDKEEETITYVNTISFYSENRSLLGKYTCQYYYCGFVTPIIDDTNYILDYYKDGILENNKIINNRYAFVYDSTTENYNEIILYDFVAKTILETYKNIKNYSALIENNIYLVEDQNNKWGVLSLASNGIVELVAPQYDFIGLFNDYDIDNGYLIADRFLIFKNNKWAIIDQNDVLLSAYIDEPVISYTGLYIKTSINNYYKIYDYNGNIILPDANYIHIAITGKYIELVDENKKITIYDPEESRVVGKTTLKTIDFSSDAVFPPYTTEITDKNFVLKVYTDQQYGTYRTYKYTA